MIAALTDGYSFAYLNELLMTSLLLFTQGSVQAHVDTDSPSNDKKPPDNTVARSGDASHSSLGNSLLDVLKCQAPLLREEMNQALEKDRRGVEKVASVAPVPQHSLAAPLDEGEFD